MLFFMLDIYSLKQLPLDIKKPHLTNLINIQIPKCFKIINDIVFYQIGQICMLKLSFIL